MAKVDVSDSLKEEKTRGTVRPRRDVVRRDKVRRDKIKRLNK